MVLPSDIKVTDAILWKGVLLFSAIDLVQLFVVYRFIKPDDLLDMKRRLSTVMAFFFFLLFGIIVSIVFWDTVYSYVFPASIRWIIPPVYGLLFALAGQFLLWSIYRMPGNLVVNFCLTGAFWGLVTHLLAIERGILDRPPMMQGTSAIPALILAMVEFIFYWCVCVEITFLTWIIRGKSRN